MLTHHNCSSDPASMKVDLSTRVRHHSRPRFSRKPPHTSFFLQLHACLPQRCQFLFDFRFAVREKVSVDLFRWNKRSQSTAQSEMKCGSVRDKLNQRREKNEGKERAKFGIERGKLERERGKRSKGNSSGSSPIREKQTVVTCLTVHRGKNCWDGRTEGIYSKFFRSIHSFALTVSVNFKSSFARLCCSLSHIS